MLNILPCAIEDVPASIQHKHLLSISSLCDLFSNWIPSTTLSPPIPDPVLFLSLPIPVLPVQGHPPLPLPRVVPLPMLVPLPSVVPLPRLDPPPRMDLAAPIAPTPTLLTPPNLVPPTPSQPVAHRTRSCLALTAHASSRHKYPSDFINNWVFSVIDATNGQTLEHLQLRSHPAYKEV